MMANKILERTLGALTAFIAIVTWPIWAVACLLWVWLAPQNRDKEFKHFVFKGDKKPYNNPTMDE